MNEHCPGLRLHKSERAFELETFLCELQGVHGSGGKIVKTSHTEDIRSELN